MTEDEAIVFVKNLAAERDQLTAELAASQEALAEQISARSVAENELEAVKAEIDQEKWQRKEDEESFRHDVEKYAPEIEAVRGERDRLQDENKVLWEQINAYGKDWQNAIAERDEARTDSKWLGEILAIIHGDGGHYHAEHGSEKATKDAIAKYHKRGVDLAQERARSCSWCQDEDGIWHTGCGNAFEYMNDGPAENGTVYCQYCGGKIAIDAARGHAHE